jgi:hypothetical protein
MISGLAFSVQTAENTAIADTACTVGPPAKPPATKERILSMPDSVKCPLLALPLHQIETAGPQAGFNAPAV